jgi:hypothetical protein
LKIVNADRIPLSKWIQFREREIRAADGHHVRDLRHRFAQHIEIQVKKLTNAQFGIERHEAAKEFEEDMRDDYLKLCEALQLEAWQMIPTKEIIVSVLGVAAIASLAWNPVIQLHDVTSIAGGIATIGGGCWPPEAGMWRRGGKF